MARIENSLHKTTISKRNISKIYADKHRCISESLLELLLSLDSTVQIDEDKCQKLFQGLCISQRHRVQILAATLLDKCCKRQPYWGDFLANTLASMFSSSYTAKFPQDRVFIVFAFLVKKCSNRSAVLDATLRVIAQALLPMSQSQGSLLAATVDLSLLGWLLLFLSLQLDMTKSQNTSRWEWVTGEMAGKAINENINSNRRKKLHGRFLQYKEQLHNLDVTHKVVQTSTQVQVCTVTC